LSHIGHPIFGDHTYGGGDGNETTKTSRMFLHSWRLRIPLDKKRRKNKNPSENILAIETKDPFQQVLDDEVVIQNVPEFKISIPSL